MLRTILEGFPRADIVVQLVWIDMLPSDEASAARRLSGVFQDPRVTQFHDPRKCAGHAFAAGRVQGMPAWDIYMFFQPGAVWASRTPAAFAWAHQLSRVEEASHLRAGPALAAALHQAMLDLGFKSTGPPPDQAALDEVKQRIYTHLSREMSDEDGQQRLKVCARCAKRGGLGQCMLSDWRFVAARKVEPASPGDPVRFEMTGSATPLAGETEPEEVAGVVFDLQIDGLACQECLKQVAAWALVVPEVSRVEVTFDSGLARVWAREGSEGVRGEVVSRLTELGYGARLQPTQTTSPAGR